MIFRKLAMPVVLGLLALMTLSMPVGAGISWCRSDPIVRLNGTDVQILVAVPKEFVAHVNGPIDVKVKSPRGVESELIMTDPGFNGHGEKVTLASDRKLKVKDDGSFDVEVTVKVPFDKSAVKPGVKVPVEVTIYPGNDAPVVINYGHDKITTTLVTVHPTN